MPAEEYNALTSVVILSDCLWAHWAVSHRQKAKSHKKFIDSLSSELKTLGERNPLCLILLHHARAHTTDTDRASLGNAATDLLAKEGARLAYAVPHTSTPPQPALHLRYRNVGGPPSVLGYIGDYSLVVHHERPRPLLMLTWFPVLLGLGQPSLCVPIPG